MPHYIRKIPFTISYMKYFPDLKDVSYIIWIYI